MSSARRRTFRDTRRSVTESRHAARDIGRSRIESLQTSRARGVCVARRDEHSATSADLLPSRGTPRATSDNFASRGYSSPGRRAISDREATHCPRVGNVSDRVSTHCPRVGNVSDREATYCPRVGNVSDREATRRPRVGAVSSRATTACPRVGTVSDRAATRCSQVGPVSGQAATACSRVGPASGRAATGCSRVGAVWWRHPAGCPHVPPKSPRLTRQSRKARENRRAPAPKWEAVDAHIAKGVGMKRAANIASVMTATTLRPKPSGCSPVGG